MHEGAVDLAAAPGLVLPIARDLFAVFLEINQFLLTARLHKANTTQIRNDFVIFIVFLPFRISKLMHLM